MPFRFRRSIRIAPGIRVNVSKSGLSTSIGGRGAHVTLGRGRIRRTVGIPGSGLSYTTSSRLASGGKPTPSQPLTWWRWLIGAAILFGIARWLGWL
jgi:hypothetical protein